MLKWNFFGKIPDSRMKIISRVSKNGKYGVLSREAKEEEEARRKE